MGHGIRNDTGVLRYAQQNIFLTSLRHIDLLLSEIETITECEAQSCVFPRFQPDFDGQTREEIHKIVANFRGTIRDSMQRMAVPMPTPEIPASHAIESNLDFVDVDIEELRPRYLRAYGTLTPETADDLNAVLDRLQEDAHRFRQLLHKRRAAH
jgi:hypothetical protein